MKFVCRGKIFPKGVAADSYKKAVDAAIKVLREQEGICDAAGQGDKTAL